MPMVALDSIKAWLKIAPATTTEDANLTEMRDAIEELVLDYCDTRFEPTIVTGELVAASGTDLLLVQNYPLISVQALYSGVDSNGTGGTLVAPYGFTVTPHGVIVPYLMPYRGALRIDYTYGYAAVPAKVKLAIKIAVEAFQARKESKSIHIASRSRDGETTSYMAAWDKDSGLPEAVVAMLQDYRASEIPLTPRPARSW